MTSKKRALGRGLDAILQSPETDITSRDISGNYVAGAIANIDVEKIESNPFQPRTEFEAEALEDLAASIREQGVIQPITIRKLGYDHYQIISGERRLRATKLAGLKHIPSYIRVANDEQMLEMALIENTHREDLNPIEIAISYQRLIEECSLTQDTLSNKVGRNRSTISNYIRLLKLVPEIQLALRNKYISMGHARALITIADPEKQKDVLFKIIDRDLSVREVEKIARSFTSEKETPAPQAESMPEEILQMKEMLSGKFRTPVRITKNTKGKGNIVISFSSENDLDRILSILNRS